MAEIHDVYVGNQMVKCKEITWFLAYISTIYISIVQKSTMINCISVQ